MTAFDITVDANIDEVADILSDIGERVVQQAHIAAVNKTMTQTRTAVRKEISQRTGVPSRLLSKRFKLHRAKRTRPQARLFVGTMPVPAIDVGARQTRQGISHRGPGGRVKKANAFIQTMRSGHRGVFQRRGRARLPIDEVKVPIHEPASSAARRHMRDEAPRAFLRIYNQEFQFRTQRAINRRRR